MYKCELFKFGRKLAGQYKNIYRFWSCGIYAINIYGPDDIEVITSGYKHNEKSFIYGFLKPWLGDGLLISKGSKWHQRRKILTPAFHFNILRQFCTTMEENSQRLVRTLAATRGKPVDVIPIASEHTLNIICETAMGTRLRDEADDVVKSYKDAIYDLGQILLMRFVKMYYYIDFIFHISPLGRRQQKHLDNLHNFTKRVITERKEYVEKHGLQYTSDTFIDAYVMSKRKKTAMLDLLITAEKDNLIDQSGLQEEVDTFMFEGHDTTASGLQYLLMLLANNKHVQDKIVSELEEVFGESDRAATIEDLSKLHYLERCIKESLRLYPPVPFISRVLSEPVQLSGYSIPKGGDCHIHIFDLHRRADLFPDPLRFDPDRFLPEQCAARHPYAYIPFSAGPRNCIGQKFALLEMKSTVAAILRKFDLEPVTRPQDIEFFSDIILRNSNPIYVVFMEKKYDKHH